MGKTKIEWAEFRWNPIRGCSLVSEGCRNCYAMKQAHRFSGPGGAYEGLTRIGKHGPTWTGKIRVVDKALAQPLRWRKPRRVFVNSMSDLFHEDLTNEQIAAVFGVMAATPRHTFQVLTKRPARMLEWFRWVSENTEQLSYGPESNDDDVAWCDRSASEFRRCISAAVDATGYGVGGGRPYAWPLPNVWLGVSVENQAAADERTPFLLATPAAVRFISAEPLLGPVNLGLMGTLPKDIARRYTMTHEMIDWVIVGGESQARARPMHPDWARAIRDECVGAGVPFFFKQWGEWGLGRLRRAGTAGRFVTVWPDGNTSPIGDYPRQFMSFGGVVLERLGKKAAGRLLDGREWNQQPTGATEQ